MDTEIWLWITFAIGVVGAALIILLLVEGEKKKPPGKGAAELIKREPQVSLPSSTSRTITADMYRGAKDKLRILDLEREILSYAIRRLYEAGAEGKITEEERDRLAVKYKEDLARIKEEIARGESIIALNELERMQEEFVKLFSERYQEIAKKIEEVRKLSGLVHSELEKPTEREAPERPEELEATAVEEGLAEAEKEAEAPEQPLEEALEKTKRKVSKPRPPSEPEKTEAEKKVEQIVAEVEKVLKKLGQMEAEG